MPRSRRGFVSTSSAPAPFRKRRTAAALKGCKRHLASELCDLAALGFGLALSLYPLRLEQLRRCVGGDRAEGVEHLARIHRVGD
jgi:hypothetical protein